jgi:hypothetical protein
VPLNFNFKFFYLKDILIVLLYFQKRRKNILTFRDEYLGDNWLLCQIHFLKDICCDAWNNLKVYRHPTTVSWLRPEEGFIKLDVDDNSLRNPGRIRFEGLLRNSEGRWLMSFTGYEGFGSNLLL